MSCCLVGDIKEETKKASGQEHDNTIPFRPELRNPFQHEMPRLWNCRSPALHTINRERSGILYSQRDNMWGRFPFVSQKHLADSPALLRSSSRSNRQLLGS
jgi:hypothetical protein